MSNESKIQYSDTLHVKDHCLCLHAQRAARALARRFDNAFRHLNINNGQFSLLMALNRPEAPTIAPVAELLAMDRTTLTAALKPLEKNGLVAIKPDEKDRRSRRLHLTEDGKALLSKALPIWIEEHEKLEAELPDNMAEILRTGLRAIA
ncbi:MarR family winged helix-turn-helix transcriptional regulator [Rhizobium sp. L1K21]|uniref:MarR family winged helix-turn-helix transcriptional regulator n=1 Tax=Rhizobium sp. L1K21 TaxID=2954933 RepID=UPI002093CBC0|nr:MarR family transcriptional regulator [Rhizobium sp. L1K21]MCO6185671.1 MarR family transcriptional regulator [Rhizobium sp. L1K21]